MYKESIHEILLGASKIAKDKFGKVSASVKPEDNNQVLTSADIEIGKYIIGQIKESYPNANIIDEEAGAIDNKSELTWVVDPIDGTSNFAKGLPHYGIMIGLLKGNGPIAGGVALPFFDEIYLAEKGQGATCNGKKIRVSSEDKLKNCLVVYQIDGHQEAPEITRDETKLLAEVVLNIRNLRTTSSVFDLVSVANGKYGAILNKTSKIWDNVAQQIIIEEAGGVYTDFYGEKMNYTDPFKKAADNFTYCASSPLIHEQLMDIITK